MFRKLLSICGILTGLGVALIFPNSPASALEAGDVVMQLNPAEQSVDLVPGEKFTGEIEVKNIGRLPYSFTLSTRPYQVKNEVFDPDFETENNFTLLKNWISFPTTQYELEPGEEVIVKYQIAVPENAPGGGQYAAIIVETRDSIDESSIIHTVGQLASIVYARVEGDIKESGMVVSHEIPSFRISSPISASVVVRNDGNSDFRVKQKLTVNNFFNGQEVYSADSSMANGGRAASADPRVMPETSRLNTLTWEGSPKFGLFRARQQISFLDYDESFDAVVFVCPLWLLLGIVFVVVLGIVWIILRSLSRKQKSSVI